MSWYDVARFCVSATFPLFHPAEVVGAENIPENGPYIICSNHINFLDPLMLAWVFKNDIRFMAKKELFDSKLIGWLMRRLKSIPVDRGANDMNAIRGSLGVIKQGEVLGIFPEGHRFTDGTLHEFQNGVSLLVTRSKAKVVPVMIYSSYKLFRKVRVVIGEPFEYTMTPGLNGSEQLNTCTKLIYERVSNCK